MKGKKFDLGLFSARNNGKMNMEERCFAEMQMNEKYCGDDPHALTIKLFKEDFGIELTNEQLQAIATMGRSRLQVFKNHKYLDKRKRTLELAENDRNYHGKR